MARTDAKEPDARLLQKDSLTGIITSTPSGNLGGKGDKKSNESEDSE